MAAAVVPRGARSKKYSGTPTRAARPKAEQLPLGEIECDFGLDPGQVLGYRYVCDTKSSSRINALRTMLY